MSAAARAHLVEGYRLHLEFLRGEPVTTEDAEQVLCAAALAVVGLMRLMRLIRRVRGAALVAP